MPDQAIVQDQIRRAIEAALRTRRMQMREVSLLMGRNQTYLQQYLRYGKPSVLNYADAQKLSRILYLAMEELGFPGAEGEVTEKSENQPSLPLPETDTPTYDTREIKSMQTVMLQVLLHLLKVDGRLHEIEQLLRRLAKE